ncbi:MAG: hypothetical protein AAGB04_22230 [Pseudomonadota bacterium]
MKNVLFALCIALISIPAFSGEKNQLTNFEQTTFKPAGGQSFYEDIAVLGIYIEEISWLEELLNCKDREIECAKNASISSASEESILRLAKEIKAQLKNAPEALAASNIERIFRNELETNLLTRKSFSGVRLDFLKQDELLNFVSNERNLLAKIRFRLANRNTDLVKAEISVWRPSKGYSFFNEPIMGNHLHAFSPRLPRQELESRIKEIAQSIQDFSAITN